jgi:hypothetical protein
MVYTTSKCWNWGISVLPIGSMYAIYGNIYHQHTPNVSIYTIHGSYGLLFCQHWDDLNMFKLTLDFWRFRMVTGTEVDAPRRIPGWGFWRDTRNHSLVGHRSKDIPRNPHNMIIYIRVYIPQLRWKYRRLNPMKISKSNSIPLHSNIETHKSHKIP